MRIVGSGERESGRAGLWRSLCGRGPEQVHRLLGLIMKAPARGGPKQCWQQEQQQRPLASPHDLPASRLLCPSEPLSCFPTAFTFSHMAACFFRIGVLLTKSTRRSDELPRWSAGEGERKRKGRGENLSLWSWEILLLILSQPSVLRLNCPAFPSGTPWNLLRALQDRLIKQRQSVCT